LRVDLQLFHALIKAPFSLCRMRTKSLQAMGFYLATAFGVFGLVSWLAILNQEVMFQWFLDYLFPQDWHWALGKIVDKFFESQAKTILSSMILSGALVAASIILFPLKEYYSAAFEREGRYDNGPLEEFSLIQQGIEEAKLLFLYLTVQAVVVWIGYYPFSATQWIAMTLSTIFLFASFGLDLIAPTLQRHRISYALMIKVLLKHPWLTMGFGMLFTAPTLLLGNYILTLESLTLIETASILFGVNIIALTLAVPVGTHIASLVLDEARNTTRPTPRNRAIAYATLTVLLCVFSTLHSFFIMSLHHKSQVLKCNYSIDWDTFDVDFPGFKAFFKENKKVQISFVLNIANPTEFDVVIEESQLFIRNDGKEVSVIDMPDLAVSSRSVAAVPVKFDAQVDFSSIPDFKKLLKNWEMQLEYEVAPGIPMIVSVL